MFRLVEQMRIGDLIQVKAQTVSPRFRHDRHDRLPMLHGVSELVHKNVNAALVKPA